ncbi:carboxypeptidase-like regulatory domain-containing protein [Saprospiraceae bacterium]|nr:carboxypeptidase-like regulatory domain-containing protein [Saprospiraceae bacterium]
MKIQSIIYSLVLIALLASCREEIDKQEEVINTPTTVTKVESSVMGIVTDGDGLVVDDALVRFADISTNTDENGVFQFEDEKLIAEGTFITVEKDGYFEGSRMFYPEIGNVNRITIQLMERVEVAQFSASTGSEVTFENVKLDFAPNGIVNEDGSEYNGNVIVAAKYLDPALAETHEQMPGDLTAISEENELVALSSYAMIVVELTGDNGELLQLKEGVPCPAKIPVNPLLQASAPNEIEFWYFDEEIGRWIEEGMAQYQNGFYEVDIPHFTFWNCDVPNNFIDLGITVHNYDGYFSDAKVKITEISTGTSRFDRTDNNGYVSGAVPDNQELLLEVLDDCEMAIYSENIGSFTDDAEISVSLTFDNFLTISGELAACDGELSEATYVRLEIDGVGKLLSIDDNQTFSASISYCDEANTVFAQGIDPLNGLGSGVTGQVINGDIDFGILELCDTILTEVVTYAYGDTLHIMNAGSSGNNTHIYYYTMDHYLFEGDVTKTIVQITILDWMTGDVKELYLLYDYVNPDNSVSFAFPESGFIAEGIGQSYIVNQFDDDYLVFKGVLSDFTITDNDLWDESFNPLTYYFALPIL